MAKAIFHVDERRIRQLNRQPMSHGPIVYWMSRDQRVSDNWALLYAQELALNHKRPLIVVFNLFPEFLGATLRQYDFMIQGLKEVEVKLSRLNIPFVLLTGRPEEEIPRFCKQYDVGACVTDFSPLRISVSWKAKIAQQLSIQFYEVDAHNVVPCWQASMKQEYAAYTFRPKIKALLPKFLTDVPHVQAHPFVDNSLMTPVHWDDATNALKINQSVYEGYQFVPGEDAAREMMTFFLAHTLRRYEGDRNDPNKDGQSQLSPYLHFGHISAQRLAFEVSKMGLNTSGRASFLEELIIRKELSDNFCFYNEHYDSVECFPRWAQASLDKHAADVREYLYDVDDFESERTHDLLWNAAQIEMVRSGKMHGYMRMYWAKKILEWSESPQKAMDTAVYLNDKYSLDGRDPNGYAGIAWSIGGVHDRAWFERPVFGKIRYMNANGCKKKFDVDVYIERWVGDGEKNIDSY